MKEIRIDYLVLENFKCHDFLRLDLGGRDAVISGDNASGKTSVYDAFVWLLFGKDSMGNAEKLLTIKPLDGLGRVKDPLAVTAVEAGLLVDGERLVLRRTLRECWAVPRGGREAVFEGNTSEYFVDGVPLKKGAFDKKVAALVPEGLFRMLTSVTYFASELGWVDRRALLFDMAGVMSDERLMEEEPRFHGLHQALGKLELRELKARLLQEKKGLSGLREDIPGRIQECQRILRQLEEVDFAAARQEEARLEQELAQAQALLAAPAGEKTALLRRELEELESRDRRSGELRRQLDALKQLSDSCGREITRQEERLCEIWEKTRQLKEGFFAGERCPVCGQRLPEEALRTAREEFESNRQRQLQALEAESLALAKEQKLSVARLEELEQQRLELRSRLQELGEDLPRQIREKRQALGSAEVDRQAMSRKEAAFLQLRQVRRTLAKADLADSTRQRIGELEQEEENARAELERIQELLFAMEDFQRFKAERLERSVNGMFRLAAFRLFREQTKGGLEERCDVLYRGVPYLGLNNGARVNVGIDIINSLSRHYGVRVPLFVDNAEAVTRLEHCGGQTVRLAVQTKAGLECIVHSA